MSGGVDSSIAAALLKEKGCDVIGVTLKLFDYPGECGAKPKKSCCSSEDVYDARRVAEKIDIPFYVLDYKDHFRKYVIGDFISEYLEGRTPNPCIVCNDKIKFHYLLQQAGELGARYVATGHYAINERDENEGLFKLKKGLDATKDQSYFLFNLTQRQLKKILFPLGAFSKEHVRELARKFGLKVAQKPDSQEICFVTDNDYRNFIAANVDKSLLKPGYIVDETGARIGEHRGIYAYTIGQRRGLGISSPHPLYVLGFEHGKNEVIVGRDSLLYKNAITVDDVSFVSGKIPGTEMSCEVKIRYLHSPAKAVIMMLSGGSASVSFATPQRAVTPGQAAVFYSGDEVIGGGWIRK